jgi:MFS transporter, DHA1 family, tetracycline resistance protein
VGLGGLGVVAAAVHRQAAAGPVPPLLENIFFAVSAVAVVGFAFVNPSVSALLSKGADPDEQGEVLGVNQSFASLGRILGPFLGSLLFSLHESRALPFVAAVAVLCVVAALLPRATAISASPSHIE